MQTTSRPISATSTQQLNKPTLSLGSNHADVAELQALLGRYVINPKVSGGVFDALTDYAVRLFQYRMFLTEDGIVGTNTWRALYAGAPVHMPLLQIGDRKPEVVILREALTVAGYGALPGNNVFDREVVLRSVIFFQADHGLVSDGIVGPNTWHALSKTRLEDPTESGTIRVINQQDEQKLHAAGITDIAVEPFLPAKSNPNHNIATASRDITVRLWQSGGTPIGPVYTGDRGAVSSVAFHPNREQLISGTFGGTVRISDYNANTLNDFPARGGSVIDLAVDPQAQYIVTSNGDGALRMFNLEGTLLRELRGPNRSSSSTQAVAISRQGQLVAGNNNLGVNLWDNPLEPNSSPNNISSSRSVNAVAFSPNGYKLAIARGRLLQIYSNQRQALTATTVPDTTINDLAFSTSGRYVALGCHNGKVYIFDLQAKDGEGAIAFTLDGGHSKPIKAVAFSRSEFNFYSADDSGKLVIWGVGKGLPNNTL